MNWIRPLHRWILDPVCWVFRDMIEDMINGLIEVPPNNLTRYIKLLVALSPRDGKGILINTIDIQILIKKETYRGH